MSNWFLLFTQVLENKFQNWQCVRLYQVLKFLLREVFVVFPKSSLWSDFQATVGRRSGSASVGCLPSFTPCASPWRLQRRRHRFRSSRWPTFARTTFTTFKSTRLNLKFSNGLNSAGKGCKSEPVDSHQVTFKLGRIALLTIQFVAKSNLLSLYSKTNQIVQWTKYVS